MSPVSCSFQFRVSNADGDSTDVEYKHVHEAFSFSVYPPPIALLIYLGRELQKASPGRPVRPKD